MVAGPTRHRQGGGVAGKCVFPVQWDIQRQQGMCGMGNVEGSVCTGSKNTTHTRGRNGKVGEKGGR